MAIYEMPDGNKYELDSPDEAEELYSTLINTKSPAMQGLEAIEPGLNPIYTPPTTTEDVLGKVEGTIGTAGNLLGGMVSIPIGGMQGITNSIMNGTFGTSKGVREAIDTLNKNMEYGSYTPKTEVGKETAEKLGHIIEPLTAIMPDMAAMHGLSQPLVRGRLFPKKEVAKPVDAPLEETFSKAKADEYKAAALEQDKVEVERRIADYQAIQEKFKEATTDIERAELNVELIKAKQAIYNAKEKVANNERAGDVSAAKEAYNSRQTERDKMLNAHAEEQGITRAELDKQLADEMLPTKQDTIDALLTSFGDKTLPKKMLRSMEAELRDLGIEDAWQLGRRKVGDEYVFSKEAYAEDIRDLYAGKTGEPRYWNEKEARAIANSNAFSRPIAEEGLFPPEQPIKASMHEDINPDLNFLYQSKYTLEKKIRELNPKLPYEKISLDRAKEALIWINRTIEDFDRYPNKDGMSATFKAGIDEIELKALPETDTSLPKINDTLSVEEMPIIESIYVNDVNSRVLSREERLQENLEYFKDDKDIKEWADKKGISVTEAIRRLTYNNSLKKPKEKPIDSYGEDDIVRNLDDRFNGNDFKDATARANIKLKGTNATITPSVPQRLHATINSFLHELGLTDTDVRITDSGGVKQGGVITKGNSFYIYLNVDNINAIFDNMLAGNPHISKMYESISREDQFTFRQSIVLAHELGHVFFYKMAYHYWRNTKDVADLIKKYTNWAKKNPEAAKVSGYLTPEQFMGEYKNLGLSEKEKLLSFKEYFANQVAKQLLYDHSSYYKDKVMREVSLTEEASSHGQYGKEEINIKERSSERLDSKGNIVLDEAGNPILEGTGEFSAKTRNTKVESNYQNKAVDTWLKPTNELGFRFYSPVTKLFKGMVKFLHKVFDNLGKNIKDTNLSANPYIAGDIIQKLIRENKQIDELGSTIWNELDKGKMPKPFKSYEDAATQIRELKDYGGTPELAGRPIDYFPSNRRVPVDIAIRKAETAIQNDKVDDISSYSAGFIRNAFGKRTVAGIYYDNPLIQAAKTIYNDAQRRTTELQYKLLNGDFVQGVAGPLRTLASTLQKNSPMHFLKTAKAEDLSDIHNVLRASYDIKASEPKHITLLKESKDYKGLLNAILADYKTIGDGSILRGVAREAYDSFTKMWATMYVEEVKLQHLMKKKHIEPYHPGWYPAVRTGDFYFTLSYNGTVVHAQYFRTKELAQKVVDRFNGLSQKHGIEISTVQEKPKGRDVQSSMELVRLYGEMQKERGNINAPFDVDEFLERIQTFGGKLGKHHEYRYNTEGYLGTELFYNKAEHGDSFRRAIESAVKERTNILKKMIVTHGVSPILLNKNIETYYPNTFKTIQQMHDMMQNTVPNLLEPFDKTIDAKFEQLYLAARKPVAKGLNKLGFKNIDPDWQPPVSSLKKFQGATSNLFYTWALMTRPAFWVGQALTPITTVPRVLLRERGFIDTMATMGEALQQVLHPSAEFKADAMRVRDTTDTFHPQFINDFNKLDFLDKIFGENGANAAGWLMGQKQSTAIDAWSRYYSFAASWTHNKKMGLSGDRLINKAIEQTGEMAVLYGRSEKAPIFEKIGMIGEMASPLQTFGQAQLGNMIADARRMLKGDHNWKPFVATYLMTFIMGGTMGTALVAEYEFFRKVLGLEDYIPSVIEMAMGGHDFMSRVVSHGAVSASTTLIPGMEEGLDIGSSLRANPILGGIVIGDRDALQMLPAVSFAVDTTKAMAGKIKSNIKDVPLGEERENTLKLIPGGYKAIVDAVKFDSTTRKYVPDKYGDNKTEQTGQKLIAQALGTNTIKDSREQRIMFLQKQKREKETREVTNQIELIADAIQKNNHIAINRAITKLVELRQSGPEIASKIQSEMLKRNIPAYIRAKFGTRPNMSPARMRTIMDFNELEE